MATSPPHPVPKDNEISVELLFMELAWVSYEFAMEVLMCHNGNKCGLSPLP